MLANNHIYNLSTLRELELGKHKYVRIRRRTT